MRLTGGRGVDVLYDNIANPKVLPQAFRAIGFDGRLVTAGAHAGPNVTIDFAHLYHKRITIKGRPGYHAARCCRNVSLPPPRQGSRSQIERILPLSQAAVAHRLVESGESAGQDRARSDAGIGSPRNCWARIAAALPGPGFASAYIPATSVITDDMQGFA